jgi:type II secretory pathway pseudopilin PulG
MKLSPKQLNSVRINCLQKSKRRNQKFRVVSCDVKEMGFSIIELLLATALALIAVNASAQLINRLNTSGLNRRAAATSAIQVAISNDLAWFRQYAVLWRMHKGPFSDLKTGTTDQVTKLTTLIYEQRSSPSNQYEPPPKSECLDSKTEMASKFQNDAASLILPSNNEAPNPINSPPNTVPIVVTPAKPVTVKLPESASGFILERTLQPDGNTRGTLTITYTLSQSGNQVFERSSSLYLPAAGWCQ